MPVHQTFLRHSGNEYLMQSYTNVGHSIEALRYRFMDTASYRSKAFDEHQKIAKLLAEGNISRAVNILIDHIRAQKDSRLKCPGRREDYVARTISFEITLKYL